MDSRHDHGDCACGAPVCCRRAEMGGAPADFGCDPLPAGVVPATATLAAGLADRLSGDHRREIRDTAGLDPRAAVAVSLAASVEAYALIPPGEARAAFMMGVEAKSPITGGALVWMLASDDIRLHVVAALRAARWGIRRAFRATGAARLEQYIPAWYRTGLRFARRVGFVATPSRLSGSEGVELRRVVIHPPFVRKG